MPSTAAVSPSGSSAGAGKPKNYLPFGNLKAQTYDTLFSTVWSALALNMILAVINAPLILALSVVAEPFRAWPFFMLLSLPLGPCMAAVFSCLDRFRTEQKIAPVRDLLHGFRRYGLRALGIWGAGLGLGAVLLVDLILLQQTPFGALATPPLAVLMLMVFVTTVSMLWASVAYPRAGFGTLAKVSLVVAVRRWNLTLFSLMVLGALTFGIAMAPPIGLLIGPALALYIVFNNCRQAFLLTIEPDQVDQLPFQRLSR